MLSSLHAARWTLGGTFAVVAGLAASAEPLAPMPPQAHPPSSVVEAAAPLRPSLEAAQSMAQPSLRPQARALASIPVEIAVRSGAAVRPEARAVFTAEARWDDRAQGARWSVAAMQAIEEAPRDLTEIVPADIDDWCPGYENNPPHLRAAFWVGTVSALARYESTFNPEAVGGGGAWHGLLQISPATARHYGCDATTPAELQDGEANLECAIRIMSRTVTRDGVVAAGDEGIAADWGPMSNDELREKMRAWVKDRSYCEANMAVMASLRPVARPDSAITDVVLTAGDLSSDRGPGEPPRTLAFLETSP